MPWTVYHSQDYIIKYTSLTKSKHKIEYDKNLTSLKMLPKLCPPHKSGITWNGMVAGDAVTTFFLRVCPTNKWSAVILCQTVYVSVAFKQILDNVSLLNAIRLDNDYIIVWCMIYWESVSKSYIEILFTEDITSDL